MHLRNSLANNFFETWKLILSLLIYYDLSKSENTQEMLYNHQIIDSFSTDWGSLLSFVSEFKNTAYKSLLLQPREHII